MKVGNLVNDLAVVDVKRVNKLNLIQFLKDVNSYLELGYKIDVNSGRQVGLVLSVDMFKVEDNKKDVEVKVTVGKTEMVEEKSTDTLTEVESTEDVVKKPAQRTKKTT